MAITVTFCRVDQLSGVNSSCATTAERPSLRNPSSEAPPVSWVVLVRPTVTWASMSCAWSAVALLIVITRPLTVASNSGRESDPTRVLTMVPRRDATVARVSPNTVVYRAAVMKSVSVPLRRSRNCRFQVWPATTSPCSVTSSELKRVWVAERVVRVISTCAEVPSTWRTWCAAVGSVSIPIDMAA